METKKAQVHMLPTEKKSNIIKVGNSTRINYRKERTIANSTADHKNYELYITTNEEIKELP